jgi:hypothetical protein
VVRNRRNGCSGVGGRASKAGSQLPKRCSLEPAGVLVVVLVLLVLLLLLLLLLL